MNRFLSIKFRFYSFLCITLLLFVHGYNLQQTYLTPFSTVDEPLTFTTFIEYFFANGALRFRIPMLFIISGYLFALQDKKPYIERMKRRAFTLLVPFFIWSAFGLLITYLWQQFPLTAQAVKDSNLDQLGDQRPYEEIGWPGVLYRWAVRPVSFHLWFIRSLFIYNALYPVIRWVVTRYPIAWFVAIYIFWHTIFSFMFIEGQGLFFFSLGIWLYKRNYPIHKKPKWFSHYLSWLFYIGISIIKTFMAFELDPVSTSTYYVLYAMQDISIAAGILAFWFGADFAVRWFMNQKWFVWASSFSFIIYAMHVPLIQYTTKLAFIILGHFKYYRLTTYIVVPTLIFFVCLCIGSFIRKAFPKAYRTATGGRGF